MLPSGSLVAIFIFSFLLAIGPVISPGPVSTAIVSQAPRRGWVVGPLVASGHVSLELLLVILIGIGLGAGLAKPGIQTAIALLGGLLLVYMGVILVLDAWLGKARLPGPDERLAPMSPVQLVGLGVAATVSNPFWYAWWVTVAAGYLAQAQAISLGAVAAFYLGHISVDLTWDTLLSSAISGGKRWMNDRVYRLLIAACGLFFIYVAVGFLRTGLAGLG